MTSSYCPLTLYPLLSTIFTPGGSLLSTRVDRLGWTIDNPLAQLNGRAFFFSRVSMRCTQTQLLFHCGFGICLHLCLSSKIPFYEIFSREECPCVSTLYELYTEESKRPLGICHRNHYQNITYYKRHMQ